MHPFGSGKNFEGNWKKERGHFFEGGTQSILADFLLILSRNMRKVANECAMGKQCGKTLTIFFSME